MGDPAATSAFERRCAGLAFIEQREMTLDEVGRLAALVRRQRVLGWISLTSLLLIPTAWAGYEVWRVSQDPMAMIGSGGWMGAVACIAYLFLGLPMLILKSQDGFLRAWRLSRDLRGRRVERFEGPTLVGAHRDLLVPKLFDKGLVDELAPAHRLERLAHSGYVLSVDDRTALSKWLTAKTAVVARRANANAGDGPAESERPFETAERVEIGRHVRRLQGSPLWLWLPLGYFVLCGTMWASASRRGWTCCGSRPKRSPASRTTSCVYRESRGLRLDLVSNAAVRFAGYERLRHADLLWTFDGEPAGWRYAED